MRYLTRCILLAIAGRVRPRVTPGFRLRAAERGAPSQFATRKYASWREVGRVATFPSVRVLDDEVRSNGWAE